MANDIIKPGIILLLITAVAAALLGFINNVTEGPIAEQEKLANETAMQEVLPEAESFNDTIELNEGDILSYSEGLDGSGNSVGYAFSVSTKGYSKGLNLMIGISENGAISGVTVVSHGETPGLGANAKDDPSFTEQFKDKQGELSVIKNGAASDSQIQAITGATITSRAVTNAVNAVQNYFHTNLS